MSAMTMQRRLFVVPAERSGPTTIELGNWEVHDATRLRVRQLCVPQATTDESTTRQSDAVLLVVEGATRGTLAPHVYKSADGSRTLHYTLAVPMVEGQTTTYVSSDLSWDVDTPARFNIDSVTIHLIRASTGMELDYSDDVHHSILLELEFAC